ncbi:MAG: ABC transporter permease [Eubacteriales bacterium]
MLKKFLGRRESYIVVLTIGIWIVISFLNNNFANTSYLFELIGYNSVYYICAVGVLPLMIMGGLDLSVSGIILSTSMIITVIIDLINLPFIFLVPIAAIIGLGFGLINGILIGKLKVPSVIITLGMLYIYRSITKYWFRVYHSSTNLQISLENFKLFGLSVQNLMIILMALVTYYILRYRSIGRSIFTFGGNEELAVQKGFNKYKTTIFVYGYSGLAAGIAAVMHILVLGQTNIEAYAGLDFELIIIVIIGGLSILGGYGTVIGTLFATSFIVVLKSGLVFARIPAFWHDMLVGFIIVVVVSYDMIINKGFASKLLGQGDEG